MDIWNDTAIDLKRIADLMEEAFRSAETAAGLMGGLEPPPAIKVRAGFDEAGRPGFFFAVRFCESIPAHIRNSYADRLEAFDATELVSSIFTTARIIGCASMGLEIEMSPGTPIRIEGDPYGTAFRVEDRAAMAGRAVLLREIASCPAGAQRVN